MQLASSLVSKDQGPALVLSNNLKTLLHVVFSSALGFAFLNVRWAGPTPVPPSREEREVPFLLFNLYLYKYFTGGHRLLFFLFRKYLA